MKYILSIKTCSPQRDFRTHDSCPESARLLTPLWTWSPGLTSHSNNVPSTMSAPSAGIRNSPISTLMPGNLLVDGGRLVAVIDFGCAGTGDPACDLFPAWNLLPAAGRDVFRQALAVDDATWIRGRGRTLSQALIALPYYRRTNPAMAYNARYVIQAVLDES